MKQVPPVLALLLCSISLFAQSKKGFKYLEKQKFDQALVAFSQDTSLAELQAVAYYGLAKTLSEASNPNKDFREAMRFQAQASEAWDALKTAQKTPLTKQYKVSGSSINSLKTKAEITAWKTSEKTTSLLEIDTYLDVFPQAPAYKKRKALQKRADLLKQAFNGARDYALNRYLYDKHGKYLEDQMQDNFETLETDLIESFLQEKGVAALPEFATENPGHPLAHDPAANAFVALQNDLNLNNVMAFLEEYPQSGFIPYVHRQGVALIRANPPDDAVREALSEPQALILAELEWIAEGNTQNLEKPFEARNKTGWLLYIRRAAPAWSAFRATEKMYNYYVGQRDWSMAADILREGENLFPEQKGWFSDRLEIVERPDSGSLPIPASSAINTPGDEYTPVLTADGKRLYFGGQKRSDSINGEDVFMSERRDTGWTDAVVIRELSGSGHQAPVSITGDGNQLLVFNRARPYQVPRTASGWGPMEPIDGLSDFSWVGIVQIAANNQVMFLEARGGGSEGTDIYIRLRDKSDNWGPPIRLDSVINTPDHDRSPFLHPDLRTLYFSSNGHPGLGGLDVFVSKRLDDTWQHWSKPVNLGKNLNTPGHDWGYIISTDGSTAWFAAPTESNGQDIYYVSLSGIYTPAVEELIRPDTVKVIEILANDENNKPITDGRITVKDQVTGDLTGSFRVNPDGRPTTVTVPNDRPYLLVLEKDGYFPQTMPLPKLEPGQSPRIEFEWKAPKLAPGVSRVLHIYFDFAKDTLRPESNAELQLIADLNKKLGYRIKLTGHTDNIGTPADNLDLSQRRAEAARRKLIGLGVPPDQVEAQGKGEAEPVVANDTEENRAKNRRVVIELLKG